MKKPTEHLKEKGKPLKAGPAKDYLDGIEDYKRLKPKRIKDKYGLRKKTMGARGKMLDSRLEHEVVDPVTRAVTHVDNVDYDPEFAEAYLGYEEELRRQCPPGSMVTMCKWCGHHQHKLKVSYEITCNECGMTTHYAIPNIEHILRDAAR